eukprot:gb/GEZN01004090.1/.p1 GENE.gb/GEZN01004090.1/~~gb/GEZN01004090.1/.p1  ORF type:complete len:527 (-),score=50.20 gb/GEZN01004090.1/:84-1664(-)
MWRQTAGCDPGGPREATSDKPCDSEIPKGVSGYCECTNGNRASVVTCEHDTFNCRQKCSELPVQRQQAALRAKQALEQARLRELEAVRAELNQEQGEAKIQGGETEEEKAYRHSEVKRRAKIAQKGDGGSKEPYDVLGVELEATGTEIRRAYRRLSLLLHPDKNRDMIEEAQLAFADLVAAHEILGDPEKRAAFDDYGGRKGFQTEWEYRTYGQNDAHKGFYAKEKLIVELNEKIFNRRLSGDSIWLVMFYAPWCVHCQQFIGKYRQIAQELIDEPIELGAVNCEGNKILCQQNYNIRQYPTFRLISRKRGMMQEYVENNHETSSLIGWTRIVSAEWTWLFINADLKKLTAETFQQVYKSEEFWAVLVLDDEECSACKSAITNMMRLSAGLRGLASVGMLVCSDNAETETFCKAIGMPTSPFNPQVRGWGTGKKNANTPGEMLYNPNDIEPHVALQLLEKIIKLTEADKIAEGALVAGKEAGWHEDEPEPTPTPPPPPEPMWNGPKGRPALRIQGSTLQNVQRIAG